MRVLLFILRKEFIQVFRDKTMLPIILIMPLAQLIILVHAATFEMKRIDMLLIDNDMSTESRRLSGQFEGSPFFRINSSSFSEDQGLEAMYREEADLVLVIPHGFARDVVREGNATIQLRINAINTMTAGLVQAYSQAIIRDFDTDLKAELLGRDLEPPIGIETAYWYNPELNYYIYMVPGILVILLTVIGMMLTAINIVREKEMGTIEQVNVTPVKKSHLLIGKLLPAWLISLFVFSFGLLIGWIIFGQPVVGSLLVLYLSVMIYLIAALALGLFLSTVSDSQQQVMLLMFFFMLIFVLMSGIFTPIEAIPGWAKILNIINPVAYLIPVLRMILLKGSGLKDIWPNLAALAVYGTALMSLSVWRYRKTN